MDIGRVACPSCSSYTTGRRSADVQLLVTEKHIIMYKVYFLARSDEIWNSCLHLGSYFCTKTSAKPDSFFLYLRKLRTRKALAVFL